MRKNKLKGFQFLGVFTLKIFRKVVYLSVWKKYQKMKLDTWRSFRVFR